MPFSAGFGFATRYREVEAVINRDRLSNLDKAEIGIASETCEIVGFPPLRIENINNSDKS